MYELGSWIQIYRHPTGRRLFAHRGVRKVIGNDERLLPLKTHVESAIAKDEVTMELEHKWLQAKNHSIGPAAVKLDNSIDGTLSSLADMLRATADVPMELPTKAPAKKLLEELFPAGLTGIVNLAHEEEVAAVEVLLRRMTQDFAAETQMLRLEPYVERLQELTDALRAELVKKPKDVLSFDVLRAAQEEGHRMLLETVARILGAFPGQGADEKQRARLLGPIWRQNEDIRQSRRRRRTPPDVNPETGAVVDTPPADLDLEPVPG